LIHLVHGGLDWIDARFDDFYAGMRGYSYLPENAVPPNFTDGITRLPSTSHATRPV
jgi:hypothetical protein